MTNQQIQAIWNALENYDPREWYDAKKCITMDDWAMAVESEMSHRGMLHF